MRILKILIPLIIITTAAIVPLLAQTYDCLKTSTPINVDGVLDDPAWKNANWISLRENHEGTEPLSPGTFAILWDEQFLYLGYDFQDTNILTTIDTRDARLWIQDVAEIFFSPVQTERIYYEFQFNARNNWRDVVILHQNSGNAINPLAEWNSRSTVKATISGTLRNNQDSDQGWKVEVSIPFEDLWLAENIPPISGDKWRMNVFRIDYGLEEPELTAWIPTNGASFHIPKKFGTLLFCENPDAEQPRKD